MPKRSRYVQDSFLKYKLSTKDLMEAGLITPGDKFYFKNNKDCPAVLNSQGELEWTFNSKVHKSCKPSNFSSMLNMGRLSGWSSVYDSKGNKMHAYKELYAEVSETKRRKLKSSDTSSSPTKVAASQSDDDDDDDDRDDGDYNMEDSDHGPESLDTDEEEIEGPTQNELEDESADYDNETRTTTSPSHKHRPALSKGKIPSSSVCTRGHGDDLLGEVNLTTTTPVERSPKNDIPKRLSARERFQEFNKDKKLTNFDVVEEGSALYAFAEICSNVDLQNMILEHLVDKLLEHRIQAFELYNILAKFRNINKNSTTLEVMAVRDSVRNFLIVNQDMFNQYPSSDIPDSTYISLLSREEIPYPEVEMFMRLILFRAVEILRNCSVVESAGNVVVGEQNCLTGLSDQSQVLLEYSHLDYTLTFYSTEKSISLRGEPQASVIIDLKQDGRRIGQITNTYMRSNLQPFLTYIQFEAISTLELLNQVEQTHLFTSTELLLFIKASFSRKKQEPYTILVQRSKFCRQYSLRKQWQQKQRESMNERELDAQLKSDLDRELDKEEQEFENNATTNKTMNSKYTLEEINASLLEELEEKERELEQLKKGLQTNQSDTLSGESERVVLLAKKNRTLTMTLNREKARIVKLETEVASLKKQLEEDHKEATTRSQSGAQSPSLSDSSKQQRAKYDKLMQKNAELQQQINNLKNDYTKIKNILQREIVGNETNTTQKQQEFDALLEKLMNGVSDSQMSWRGRAQQIVLLKAQLKEMKRKYEGSSQTSIPSPKAGDDVDERQRRQLERIEQSSRLELNEFKKDVAEKNEQIIELKKKLDAFNARNRNLEKTNQDMKAKMARILEKTTTDNKLIEALRNELEKKSKSKDTTNPHTTSHTTTAKLQIQNEQLEKLLEEKTEQIRSLKSELHLANTRALESLQASGAGGARMLSTDSSSNELKLSVAQIEVEKVKELTEIMRGQLAESEKKVQDLQSLLNRERQKTAELERRSTASSSRSPSNTTKSMEEMQQMRDQLMFAKEEIASLRNTLESTRQNSESEIGVYESLIQKQKVTLYAYINHLKSLLKDSQKIQDDDIPSLEAFQRVGEPKSTLNLRDHSNKSNNSDDDDDDDFEMMERKLFGLGSTTSTECPKLPNLDVQNENRRLRRELEEIKKLYNSLQMQQRQNSSSRMLRKAS